MNPFFFYFCACACVKFAWVVRSSRRVRYRGRRGVSALELHQIRSQDEAGDGTVAVADMLGKLLHLRVA